MSYRITMNDGQVYRSSEVSEEGSFLVMDAGSSSEVRVPSSNVQKIESSDSGIVGAIIAGILVLTLGIG